MCGIQCFLNLCACTYRAGSVSRCKGNDERQQIASISDEIQLLAADIHTGTRTRMHIRTGQPRMIESFTLSVDTRLLAIERPQTKQDKKGSLDEIFGSALRLMVVSNSLPDSWTHDQRYGCCSEALDPLYTAMNVGLLVIIRYLQSDSSLRVRDRKTLRTNHLTWCMFQKIEYTELIDKEEWACKWTACENGGEGRVAQPP
jgi:hypothetical protein